MRIVVVGPGAMGSLFAALLSEAGEEVVLLDKHPRRAARIQAGGVKVEGIGGKRAVAVRAVADPEKVGIADIVCIFVKSYDTLRAVRFGLPCTGPRTVVLTLQNGLGNVEQIAKFVPMRRILAGATAQGATSLGAGRVRHAGRGLTIIGFADERGRLRAIRIARVFNKAGIRARVSSDLRKTLWTKLIANASINPLTAIFGVPNGALLNGSERRRMLRDIIGEAVTVAGAGGISVNLRAMIRSVESVCRATGNNVSSMLQDVRRRKRTEIEAITGALVREAKVLGVSVPANKSLLFRIRRMERNYSA